MSGRDYPRVVLFGLPGIASSVVLDALLQSGLSPAACVVPAASAPHLARPGVVARVSPPATVSIAPVSSERDFIGRAWDASLPVLIVDEVTDQGFAAALATFEPDLVLVACFTRRLPGAVLRQPHWGCLNLHPSLLPAYRGPAPLFWQFRDGLTDIGVSAHWMDERLDTGDIAAQRPLALPEGCSGPDAERIWATASAELALEVVAELESGRRPGYPQPTGGSYQKYPAAEDFTLSVEWPARRAFIFMRGTEAWGRPYDVTAGGRAYTVHSATGYAPDMSLSEPVMVDGPDLLVQFSPGVVRART